MNSKLDPSDIVGKILYYTLVLFALQFAFGVFGPNPVSDLLVGIIALLPKIIVVISIIVIAAAIAAGAMALIQNTLGGLSYGRVPANIAGVIIVGAGGGLIKPMRTRWESILTKAEEETPKIQREARNAPSVAEQATQKAQDVANSDFTAHRAR